MKFISKYRKLRVVVRPSRKVINEVAGEQVVLVHPATICEFDGGVFDTLKNFPQLQARINCCDFHRLKDVEQLEHMLKASPEFNKSFTEYYEASPAELIAQKKKELAELQAQYGISDQDMEPSYNAPVDEDLDLQDEETMEGEETTSRDSDDQQTDFGDFRDQPRTVGEPEVEKPVKKKDQGQAPLSYAELKAKFKERFGFLPMGATAEQLIEALNAKS